MALKTGIDRECTGIRIHTGNELNVCFYLFGNQFDWIIPVTIAEMLTEQSLSLCSTIIVHNRGVKIVQKDDGALVPR